MNSTSHTSTLQIRNFIKHHLHGHGKMTFYFKFTHNSHSSGAMFLILCKQKIHISVRLYVPSCSTTPTSNKLIPKNIHLMMSRQNQFTARDENSLEMCITTRTKHTKRNNIPFQFNPIQPLKHSQLNFSKNAIYQQR